MTSLVGPISPRDEPQSRLPAFTVATQQAKPLALLDLQLDLIEQAGASECQADVSQAQQSHQGARIGTLDGRTDGKHGTVW